MLVFLTNKVPFFSDLSNILLFDTNWKKCAISEVSTKNGIIWDTDLDDDACCFTHFSNITS